MKLKCTILKTLLAIALTSLVSCASFSGEWERVDVALENQTWRFCDKYYDNDELHKTGVCRKVRECKKKFFSKKCRVIQLYCKFGDDKCFNLYKIWDKKIK